MVPECLGAKFLIKLINLAPDDDTFLITRSIVWVAHVKTGLIYSQGAIASKKSGNLWDILMHFRAKAIKHEGGGEQEQEHKTLQLLNQS